MYMFILEWFSALSALLAVFLTVQRKIICWPIGLVSVCAYGLFFYEIKLYADAGLQAFFFLTGIYGWYYWLKGGPNHGLALIKTLNAKQRVALGIVLTAAIYAVGDYLSRNTDASIPFWDSLTTGLSVAAQLLLMRKFLDSWYLWIAVDVFAIGIYAYKEAWVTCGLYAIFLVLATAGLISWKSALAKGVRV